MTLWSLHDIALYDTLNWFSRLTAFLRSFKQFQPLMATILSKMVDQSASDVLVERGMQMGCGVCGVWSEVCGVCGVWSV